MKEDSECIKKGDIVWAKVKGFPWWPGEVKRITQSTLGNNDNEKEKQVKLRLPDLKIVITGTQYGYKRPDGVLVVPIGCLKD